MARVELDMGAWLYQQTGEKIWYLDLTTSGRRQRISLHTHVKEKPDLPPKSGPDYGLMGAPLFVP